MYVRRLWVVGNTITLGLPPPQLWDVPLPFLLYQLWTGLFKEEEGVWVSDETS